MTLQSQERDSALKQHTTMLSEGATPYELGLFYRSVLAAKLWQTQSELASAVDVSQSRVSKALSVVTLPREFLQLFGPKRITFRLAARLHQLVEQFGMDNLRANAARIPQGPLTADEALTFLIRGERPTSDEKPRLCLIDQGQALRLDLPDLDRLLPHLEVLESLLAEFIPRIRDSASPKRGRYIMAKRCARRRSVDAAGV